MTCFMTVLMLIFYHTGDCIFGLILTNRESKTVILRENSQEKMKTFPFKHSDFTDRLLMVLTPYFVLAFLDHR